MKTNALEKPIGLSGHELQSSEQYRIGSSEVRKPSGYVLIALVGIPPIAAVYLLLQLQNLPNSSLSYSLLNAIVSVLFNFSSSALLKVFSFLVSLVGLSKGVTSSAR
jgi:hypothetical protein